MPRITALRHQPPRHVVVALDGKDWRPVPVEVVVAAGLWTGLELDRPRLRLLRRELRRSEALTAALRALERRELSTSELEARLEQAGIASSYRREALSVLARAGLLDDERAARLAARRLSERNAGDSAIRFQLAERGFHAQAIAAALAGIPPERARAEAVVAARGRGLPTARYLERKGFDADCVEAASGGLLADEV